MLPMSITACHTLLTSWPILIYKGSSNLRSSVAVFVITLRRRVAFVQGQKTSAYLRSSSAPRGRKSDLRIKSAGLGLLPRCLWFS